MVKDFIPARSVADTGIIIKPHLLQRNKAKSVQAEVEQPIYTGSIDTAFITGSDGRSFGGRDTYTTSYNTTVQTPLGRALRTYHGQEQAKYDGEFFGTGLVITTGELNIDNPFKTDNLFPETLYITLIQDFPSNICKISTPLTAINVTSNPRNIAGDFTSLGLSGITFTSASVDITSQATAFTFPSLNYQQHLISASQSISGCSGSITYTTAYCDIVTTGSIPYAIFSGSGTPYNLTAWFSTGSNTNTSFTASWSTNVVGITTPTGYIFTQPTGSVTITRRDNIIAECSQSISINIIESPYECQYLDYIVTKAIPDLELPPQETVITYIPCNGGIGGEEVTTFLYQLSYTNDETHSFDTCIVSGSLTKTGWFATPYYSASGICTI
jgi:hypothetical protein